MTDQDWEDRYWSLMALQAAMHKKRLRRQRIALAVVGVWFTATLWYIVSVFGSGA